MCLGTLVCLERDWSVQRKFHALTKSLWNVWSNVAVRFCHHEIGVPRQNPEFISVPWRKKFEKHCFKNQSLCNMSFYGLGGAKLNGRPGQPTLQLRHWTQMTCCTDDDNNRSYRNVCNMSFVSLSLAVIFIINIVSRLKMFLNRSPAEQGASCAIIKRKTTRIIPGLLGIITSLSICNKPLFHCSLLIPRSEPRPG